MVWIRYKKGLFYLVFSFRDESKGNTPQSKSFCLGNVILNINNQFICDFYKRHPQLKRVKLNWKKIRKDIELLKSSKNIRLDLKTRQIKNAYKEYKSGLFSLGRELQYVYDTNKYYPRYKRFEDFIKQFDLDLRTAKILMEQYMTRR